MVRYHPPGNPVESACIHREMGCFKMDPRTARDPAPQGTKLVPCRTAKTMNPKWSHCLSRNTGAESLVGHGWYRNTAAATDGEIHRNLSDRISKETSGSNRHRSCHVYGNTVLKSTWQASRTPTGMELSEPYTVGD